MSALLPTETKEESPRPTRRVRADRMDGSGEAGLEQVVEDLAADGPAPARCSDHRDRARLEEAPQGRHGADLLAALEPLARPLAELGREGDLHHAGPGADADGEAALTEHLEHPVVVGHHLGAEGGDAVRRR